MDISDKIDEVLNNNKDLVNSSSEYARLKDYYERMKNEGFIAQQEYNLPPLDTVGRRFYESASLYKKIDK